jgi:hypothetical protein
MCSGKTNFFILSAAMCLQREGSVCEALNCCWLTGMSDNPLTVKIGYGAMGK